MGNVCCCWKKRDYYEDEYSETRRILDPVGINDGDRLQGYAGGNAGGYRGGPGGYGAAGAASGGPGNDENSQSRLYNRVLDQLSARVIDISSLEKSGEQADLTDREQAIHKKLSTVRKTVVLETNKPPTPVPGPKIDHSTRSRDPVPMEDYRLITSLALKTAAAVEHGFRIHNAEPFVVSFSES
ncbi:hypothetical protein TYRP_005093 [Tyrophagus putrescentiae]|nr:hypothetical protein TYRP_005093 [Tyrophagus putrescentiae]